MMNRLLRYLGAVSTLLLLITAFEAAAQDDAVQKAIRLHHDYDFAGARAILTEAGATADSASLIEIENLLMQCDNGSSMLDYASTPTVITSKRVPAKDFYLYYRELKNRTWMSNPNAFTGDAGHDIYTATRFDAAGKEIFFSKPDGDGRWNICKSTLQGDTLWSAPVTLSASMVSSGDEIFPLLSADGKRLYFSSNGMAGMGGYDIFVSELCADGISWSAPVNLGFPFSSPYDDFLYYDTPDGKFTMFASNRDCPKDSMTIYVLAFEHNTIRKSISSVQEARSIAALRPKRSSGEGVCNPEENMAAGEFGEWYKALDRLAQVKDSIALLEEDMKELRNAYPASSGERRSAIAQQIFEGETAQMELQRRMGSVTARVREVEASYLAKGVVPPAAEQPQSRMDNGGETELQYAFAKNAFGRMPEVNIAEPEPEFDFSFTVGEQAVIVKDNTLPPGIVYQVQLCAVSSPLSIKKLRGMAPVYEVKQKTGKYIYYAGLFKTYEEAAAALPKVKKCGYSSAFVAAFRDGKTISVKKARTMK